ncbi:MAG TPA: outer membrane beta-barrel protein [Azospirillum sp.]
MSRVSKILRPALAVVTVMLLATWSQSVLAQRADTRQGADPRRAATGAAKVTTDTNADDDSQGRGDEKQISDSYQPKGMEIGSFLLLPQLETEVLYNSNVFARATDKKADIITRIAPEMQLRSRFTNHALNLTARAEQYLFRTYTNDNHLDAAATVDGRYDFSRTWEGTGFLDVFQRYEDRGSPDDVGGKHPTRTYGATGRAGTKVQSGRFTFASDFTANRRLFDNVETSTGSIIRNSDRNRWEAILSGRGSYEMFPGYAAVVEVQGNRRQYDDEFDRAGYQRSSNGWRAETGVGVDISQLIRGDFLVGYLKQNYEDSRFSDPAGFSLKSVFNWTPTRMTVVVLSLERSVLETTTVRASGMVRTGGGIIARHELQRNVVLTGTLNISQDAFEGIDQTNWTYDTRARAVWALMPEAYVGGEVGYRKRTSNVAGSEFSQAVFALRFGLRI